MLGESASKTLPKDKVGDLYRKKKQGVELSKVIQKHK